MKSRKTFILALFASLLCAKSEAHVASSKTIIKLYKFAVSTDPFCSNPVVVFASSTPVQADVMVAPALAQGFIPDGSYPCIILEISDVITVTPVLASGLDTDFGSCDPSTFPGGQVSTDICRSATGFMANKMDGTSFACADSEQIVDIYLSTASLQTFSAPDDNGKWAVNPFSPPTTQGDLAHGFKLSKPLVVSGSAFGSFGVDTFGRVNNDTSTCFYEPSFYFR